MRGAREVRWGVGLRAPSPTSCAHGACSALCIAVFTHPLPCRAQPTVGVCISQAEHGVGKGGDLCLLQTRAGTSGNQVFVSDPRDVRSMQAPILNGTGLLACCASKMAGHRCAADALPAAHGPGTASRVLQKKKAATRTWLAGSQTRSSSSKRPSRCHGTTAGSTSPPHPWSACGQTWQGCPPTALQMVSAAREAARCRAPGLWWNHNGRKGTNALFRSCACCAQVACKQSTERTVWHTNPEVTC